MSQSLPRGSMQARNIPRNIPRDVRNIVPTRRGLKSFLLAEPSYSKGSSFVAPNNKESINVFPNVVAPPKGFNKFGLAGDFFFSRSALQNQSENWSSYASSKMLSYYDGNAENQLFLAANNSNSLGTGWLSGNGSYSAKTAFAFGNYGGNYPTPLNATQKVIPFVIGLQRKIHVNSFYSIGNRTSFVSSAVDSSGFQAKTEFLQSQLGFANRIFRPKIVVFPQQRVKVWLIYSGKLTFNQDAQIKSYLRSLEWR